MGAGSSRYSSGYAHTDELAKTRERRQNQVMEIEIQMKTRLMLTLATTMVAMAMGCATTSSLQQAEADFQATTNADSEAQKELKAAMEKVEAEKKKAEELKARLALEYAKEAASAAELALTMTKKAAEQRKKACLLAPTIPECKTILEQKAAPEETKTEEPDEPDFTVTTEEPSLTIEIKGFNKDGIRKVTPLPENWLLKFEKGQLVLLMVGEEADQIKRYQWGYLKDGCYKLKDSGKFTPEPVSCPSTPPPPPVKRGQGQS